MKYNYIKNQKGFTLFEVLVYMTIFASVFTLGANYIITGFKTFRFASEEETAVQYARRASEIISKELRGANTSAQGAYPLDTIEAQNLIFFSDTDDDGETEKIRYYINNKELFKTTIEPGPLNDYTGTSTSETIAKYINNESEAMFVYYDSDNATTTHINDIRLINMIFKINVTPEIAPNDYYVESSVQLRNLKDNL